MYMYIFMCTTLFRTSLQNGWEQRLNFLNCFTKVRFATSSFFGGCFDHLDLHRNLYVLSRTRLTRMWSVASMIRVPSNWLDSMNTTTVLYRVLPSEPKRLHLAPLRPSSPLIIFLIKRHPRASRKDNCNIL